LNILASLLIGVMRASSPNCIPTTFLEITHVKVSSPLAIIISEMWTSLVMELTCIDSDKSYHYYQQHYPLDSFPVCAISIISENVIYETFVFNGKNNIEMLIFHGDGHSGNISLINDRNNTNMTMDLTRNGGVFCCTSLTWL
jgi:hypothetical protein